jgi:DNA-binding NarL/FixJ family response regulator
LHRPDVVVALSDREREIAVLAADGVASKVIAERLYLSTRTVNNHLQRAYTKLGVTNRAELAAVFARDTAPPPTTGAAS